MKPLTTLSSVQHRLPEMYRLLGLLLVCLLLPWQAGAQSRSTVDPVAHWDFEDVANLGADSAGTRDGSARGDAQTTAGRHPDERALKLGGTGYIEIPALGESMDLISQVSIEAWVKVDTHHTNVFRLRQPVALGSDRFVVANYTEGSGWTKVFPASPAPTGRWYHMVGVFDNGTMSIYIDGELSASVDVPFTETDGAPYDLWALGARTPGGSGAIADQFFVGEMDDVKVYLTALTPAQVKAAANRRPVAEDDSVATALGTCVDVSPLDNDQDPDGDALALGSVTGGPANGTAQWLDAQTLRYCPNLGFSGTDELTYEVNDGRGAKHGATVRIDVGTPSFLGNERQVQVMQSGPGWQELRMHANEGGRSTTHPALAVWRHGVDFAPLTQEQKDELNADFSDGPILPSDNADNAVDNDVILIDLNALAQIEQMESALEVNPTPNSLSKGCFGWNDKEKTKSYNFNEWSQQRDFSLTDNVNGNFSINLPIEGQATFNVHYRIKKKLCVPYKFRFKHARAYGNVSIDGGSDLGASVSLNGEWKKEWELMEPRLGSTTVWLGPIPVYLKFTLPVDVGVQLNTRLTGTIGLDSDFSAAGTFDYTCTKNSCNGTNSWQDNLSSDQITGSLEAEIKAQIYAKAQVKMAVYDDNFLYVQAGLKPYLEADLWGYYGNTCGDADGDGQNETVRALAVGVDAGYDVVYGWGGVVSDTERTLNGQRFYLGWWDLLGENGSTALAPIIEGPSTTDRGVETAWNIKMRPCYPYEEAVSFVMLPGTWNGNATIPEPQSTSPALNQSQVSRSFPTAQPYLLRARAVRDTKGRNLRTSTDRRISVLNPETPPEVLSDPVDQTIDYGQNAAFNVEATGGSLTYRWHRNGVALTNNHIYSGAYSANLTLTQPGTEHQGTYRVKVTNNVGTAWSYPAQLVVRPPTPDLVVKRWDGQELNHGTLFEFDQPTVVGVPISRAFTIENQGTASLQIQNAGQMVSGTCFREIESPVQMIAPGGSTWVRVRLHCAQAGLFNGQLTIASNDPSRPMFQVNLRGTVTSDVADIAVTQRWDNTPIADGGHFTFPDPVPVGVPTSRAFSILNEGSSDLVLSAPTALVSGTCFHQIETPTTVIPAGGSSYVRVRLHCAQAGTFTGEVRIDSNDPHNPTYVFGLTGTVSP